MKLEQEGIFMLKPLRWNIRQSENSKSVAISIEFLVTAALEGNEWASWLGEDYEKVTVWGAFYVIKRDGTVNHSAVDQLVDSLDWSGDLRAVAGDVPKVLCQGTVKAETYNGRTTYKVTWINPEDFTPDSGADPSEIGQLHRQFGSLLRAAAGGRKRKSGGGAKAVTQKTELGGDSVPYDPDNPFSDPPDESKATEEDWDPLPDSDNA